MFATHSARSSLLTPGFAECGIRVGDRVLVGGLYSGSVKYVGNLDIPHPSAELYVGARLDDPVGVSDGIWYGKRFFSCTRDHGVFVPIHKVHLLMSRKTFRSNPKSSSRIQSSPPTSRRGKEDRTSKTQKGIATSNEEELESPLNDSNNKDKTENGSDGNWLKRRPSTSKIRKAISINQEARTIVPLLTEVSKTRKVDGLPTVVKQQKLHAEGSHTSIQSETEKQPINLPKIVPDRAGKALVDSPVVSHKEEDSNNHFPEVTSREKGRRSITPRVLQRKSVRGEDSELAHCVIPALALPTAFTAKRCYGTSCSTTVEQAIAQMLREEICSVYGANKNTVSQFACLNEDYLTAKLKVLLRKLYSKPSMIQSSSEYHTARSQKNWRFHHHHCYEDPPNLFSNHKFRSKTGNAKTLARQRRIYGRIPSGKLSHSLPVIFRKEHINGEITYNSAMELGILEGLDLSKIRLTPGAEKNFELDSKKRSLLALKQELFELNRLTECAEEQLEQNMANTNSLNAINITGIRERVVGLKKKAVSLRRKH